MADPQPLPPGMEIEYTALRWEILSRIELRNQIMLATLTLAGVMLSFGVNNSSIAFVFPIIATFLATAWLQHDVRIGELSNYINEHIEDRLPDGMGWENYRASRPRKGTRVFGLRLAVLSAGGVFVVIQIVALFIGFSKFDTFTTAEWIFGIISALFVVLTMGVISTSHRRPKRGVAPQPQPAAQDAPQESEA
ncbi:MAG: hypothetical protein U0559_19060 [Anaerolineae bacterium]